MESKLVLIIWLTLIFIAIGMAVLFLIRKQTPIHTCGGLDGLDCPFGYSCQNIADSDGVGECVSIIQPIKDRIYSVLPALKPKTVYSCPESSWVDCMPDPGPAKPECNPGYLDWAKSHCPNFRGAAY